MEGKNLVEYIHIVTDMENSKLVMDNAIAALKVKAEKLDGKKYTPQPQEPSRPSMNNTHRGAAIVLVIAIVVFCWCVFETIHVLNSASRSDSVVLILTLPVGFIAFGVAMSRIDEVGEHLKAKGNYESAIIAYPKKMEQYHADMARYEADMKVEEERYRQKMQVRNFINSEVLTLEAKRTETTNRLAQMYGLGVIYGKYCNPIMVNSIYEYLASGRTSTLEGPHGAYNILETEIRLDHIITQLDRIYRSLEQIKRNQYMLYCAIKENSQKVERLAGSVDQVLAKLGNANARITDISAGLNELKSHSAAAAYAAERTSIELHYMNRMKYLAGEYTGGVFNQPPYLHY